MHVGTGMGAFLFYVPFILFALYCGSRWKKWAKADSRFPPPQWRAWLAFLAFLAATFSFLDSLALVVYATVKLGLQSYDPVLLAALRLGFWLSLGGLCMSAAGKGGLRLPAVVSNSLVLAFWVALGVLQ